MDKVTWTTEKRRVKDLLPYDENPRKMSKEQARQLINSLERFDYVELVAINTDNRIIAGHMRVHAMLKLGWGAKEIEVRIPSRTLSKDECREYLIRSNKNVGEWDADVLSTSFDPKELAEWGFEADELCDILGLDSEEEETEDESNLEPTKNPKTKLGDIYELGSHRLVCGDSTNENTVSLCLNGATPILMVTDPPYGVEYDASWRKDIKGKPGVGCRATGAVSNDDIVDWSAAWKLFPGDVAYIWHSDRFSSLVRGSIESCGYHVISQIIWAKQHFALSRGDYHWQHEPCWYAVKNGCKHNWQGARDQSTLWEISNLNAFGENKDDERTCHSTQKPLECMSRPIKNNTLEGEGVYDPFLGSGTTIIAAEKLNRVCYGLELDPAYCDLIVERWIKERKKQNKDFTVIKNKQPCEDFNVQETSFSS